MFGGIGDLSSLTSVTGGGALTPSSSATNGDFGASSDYNVGNMTFNTSGGAKNNQMVVFALVALVAFVAFKK
jgi:hypothetical protein